MKYAGGYIIIGIIFILFGCASQTARKEAEEEQAPAMTSDRHWVTTQSGCLIDSPNPISGETMTWSGECSDGKVSGRGELTWYRAGKAIGVYTGEFQDGETVERGVYTHLAPSIPTGQLPKFTLAELAKYNGQDGAPAYVAYNGMVYDVSHSFLWAGGKHLMSHYAGEELTGSFEKAPHGFEKTLALFPVVGMVVEN